MSDKREDDLWKEIDWMIFIIAILGLIILSGTYFIIANIPNMDTTFREFVLSVIINLIPTFLLFVGAYLVFRRIEKLRSEKNADVLADKIALKLNGLLFGAQNPESINSNSVVPPIKEPSSLEMKVRRELAITNKIFDEKSDPQKLVICFLNRGNNVIQLRKIGYSQTGLGLPNSALLKTYRLDTNAHDILIPVNQSKAEILPDHEYIVELGFAQKWDAEAINGLAGDWGYLHLELIYTDQILNLQYSI